MPSSEEIVRAALEQAAHGRSEQAIASLRRVLQREPANAVANNAMGHLLLKAGQHDQAAFFVQRAVNAEPRRAAFLNYLGSVYLTMGKMDEAIKALRRAVEVDPAYYPGWVGLSLALLQMRDVQSGLEAAQEGVKRYPHLPDADGKLFMALVEIGRSCEALEMVRQAEARGLKGIVPRSPILQASNYCGAIEPAAASAYSIGL